MDYITLTILIVFIVCHFVNALIQWDTNARIRNLNEYTTGENNLTKHHASLSNRNIHLTFQLEKLRHQLKQETARANHHRERCRRLRVEHRQLLSRVTQLENKPLLPNRE